MPTIWGSRRCSTGKNGPAGGQVRGVALLFGLVAVAAGLPSCSTASTQAAGSSTRPVSIIIDTDLSLWWDDATAVGMANVLEQQGRVRVLGIVSDIRNPVAVAAIDAIDTAYGHAGIPVGAVADSSADTAAHGYSDILAARLPHAIRNASGAPGAVTLYRRLLADQPDHSVTIVSIGGYTNLAGLLRSGPGQGSPLTGRRLVVTKVKGMVIEDGLFPAGGPPLTNELIDPAATRKVVGTDGWPTPIAWVDGYAGISTRVGGDLCTSTPADNPMRIVYEALFGCGPPRDGDWDGPTLLYAVGGRQGVFSQLGRGGAAVIDGAGGLSWGAGAHHPAEVFVRVTDQPALDARIDTLIGTR